VLGLAWPCLALLGLLDGLKPTEPKPTNQPTNQPSLMIIDIKPSQVKPNH